MAFPENFINELTERNDIVEVVSSYVRLSKKSGSNLFGLCPFHSEKTPSFSVSPDKQIYHCFGCGKGGGVINFVMEIENLSFPEAVEFLAKRAGMPMPEETNDRESRRRARMLELNKAAARFFYEQLSTPAGQAACDYMRKRKLSPATARNFGIGFAPDSWNSLTEAMKAKGFTEKELAEAGLVRHGKNGGVYDTFRNRLMFPVIDVRGNVIGFSGRILGDGEPKYMNSPETLVFNKSRNLFALNLAKKSKCGYIILSEGNIDVASLHQAGFDSAVASLGTSLTPEQARLISRYTDQVVIAYDNDGAGIKAAQRAIGILEKLDLKVKVLRLEGAKDPDEFIKLKGPEAFRKLLEGSEDQIDYRLRAVTEKYDLSSDGDKVAFLKEATELVARLPGAVERQVYAMRVASMAGVPENVVAEEAQRRRKRLLSSARKAQEREQTRVDRTPPGGGTTLPAGPRRPGRPKPRPRPMPSGWALFGPGLGGGGGGRDKAPVSGALPYRRAGPAGYGGFLPGEPGPHILGDPGQAAPGGVRQHRHPGRGTQRRGYEPAGVPAAEARAAQPQPAKPARLHKQNQRAPGREQPKLRPAGSGK